ncbi:hydrophobic surface binding protein [Mycena sanguinolenta]|nr:hydrophobic surface binding protein [Mycena sanguinolenta]
MVFIRITHTLSFLSLAALSLALSFAQKRATCPIESDLATLLNEATALDDAVEAFPATGGTLPAALNIHSDATTLTCGPLSEAECQIILSDMANIEVVILDALKNLIAKKPALGTLPSFVSLILADLENLENVIVEFIKDLIGICPSDLSADATHLSQNFTMGFDSAIATFSG